MNEKFVPTALSTKASEKLEEEVRNELETPDPSKERSEAVLKEAKEKPDV